jgi:UDP-2,3-diacylglucosamine pyrophosphatase LpxH
MAGRAAKDFGTSNRELYFPVVVISDLHLGMVGVQAEMLYEFLSHIRCDKLIINGDIIDGYRLNRRKGDKAFPEMHARVMDAINRHIADGTEVYYVPGNHDDNLRESGIMGKSLYGVQFADPLLFDDPKGRRIAVVHGDLFTRKLENHMLHTASLRASDALALANKAIDKVASSVTGRHVAPVARIWEKGQRHISLCDEFRTAALNFMQGNNADAVFTGHIHLPELTHTMKGLYGNSGDWVDNCTALVMNADGDWQLLDWLKERRALGLGKVPSSRQLNPDQEFRPQTERQLAAIRQLWPGKEPR